MLPEVCALRGGVCALSDEPCAAPCAALGFARAIRHMGYQHWTLQQVLERLCNPREYASDDEYARLVDDAVIARRSGV